VYFSQKSFWRKAIFFCFSKIASASIQKHFFLLKVWPNTSTFKKNHFFEKRKYVFGLGETWPNGYEGV